MYRRLKINIPSGLKKGLLTVRLPNNLMKVIVSSQLLGPKACQMDGSNKILIKSLEVPCWKVYVNRGASCSWIGKSPKQVGE